MRGAFSAAPGRPATPAIHLTNSRQSVAINVATCLSPLSQLNACDRPERKLQRNVKKEYNSSGRAIAIDSESLSGDALAEGKNCKPPLRTPFVVRNVGEGDWKELLENFRAKLSDGRTVA